MSDLPPKPEINPEAPKKAFRYFCQKVLPTVYDDSLSYYELLCKLTDKINEIITGDQTQVASIQELQELYIDLRSYIENLDLVDEVELALDKMAESGELETIMALYLRSLNVFGFKTKNDMKLSSSIFDGSICKILGATNYKTGDGAYYYIRNREALDILDDDNIILITARPTLVAEKIPDYYLNALTDIIGDLTNLTTTSKTNIVSAVNEVNSGVGTIGDLTNLTTTSKTNIVSAVNEVNSGVGTIGDLTNLTTTSKTNIVSAVNEVNSGVGTIGDLTNLTTTSKTNIVSAVNEVNSGVGTIGDLSNLTTTSKTNIVSAVNEVNSGVGTIGDLSNLTTTSKTNIVSAVNEVNSGVGTIGDLTNLTTTSKTNIVSAVNEVNSGVGTNANNIGNLNNLTTTAKNNIVAAINELNIIPSLNTVPINKGGTGATTSLDALINLGVADYNEIDFTAQDYDTWVLNVQTYVDTNLQTRRPFVFHAGWQGVGYGCGLAYQTLDIGFKFLILFNQVDEAGVKFYFKEPGVNSTWQESSSQRGYVLYDNASGTNGTITLYDSLANYRWIEIIYRNGDNMYNSFKLFDPNGKSTNFGATSNNEWGVFQQKSTINLNGTTISHGWNYQINHMSQSHGGGQSLEEKNDIYIHHVRGYIL